MAAAGCRKARKASHLTGVGCRKARKASHRAVGGEEAFPSGKASPSGGSSSRKARRASHRAVRGEEAFPSGKASPSVDRVVTHVLHLYLDTHGDKEILGGRVGVG